MIEREELPWRCERCDLTMPYQYSGAHKLHHALEDERIRRREAFRESSKTAREVEGQATLLQRNGALWHMIGELLERWYFVGDDEFARCVHCGGTPQAEWWSAVAKDQKRIVHASDCSFVRIFNRYQHAMIRIQVSKDLQRGANDDGSEDVRPVREKVRDEGEPGSSLGTETCTS